MWGRTQIIVGTELVWHEADVGLIPASYWVPQGTIRSDS